MQRIAIINFGLLCLGVLIVCSGSLAAQHITEEPMITELMTRFEMYNRANTEVRGWRIQVLSTTDRRMMESTQSEFRRKYPQYELTFEHRDPFYNLRTGAFLSQQDTRPMLRKLQRDFPGAFAVTDRFEIAEVLKYQE